MFSVTSRLRKRLNLESAKLEIAKLRILQVMLKLLVVGQLQMIITFST